MIESIGRVRARNSVHGGHWFDHSTMHFFKSRVSETAYLSADDKQSFFVSSERYSQDYAPRRYTVRVQDCETGSIDTVGNFQGYATGYNAHKVAKALSEGKTPEDVYITLNGKVIV